MQFLELTCATPEENLALDEALLEVAVSDEHSQEVLRLWEPREPMVVVGRSSRVAEEVRLEACRERGIPVLRRHSGGAAIVAAPGCLMYALVLSRLRRPQLQAIDAAHRLVLETMSVALGRHLPDVTYQGTSDLTWQGHKFSGNSMRIRRDWVLYHGTLLYQFPLQLIGQCLLMPPRQPDYRGERSHEDFVTNLPLSRTLLRQILIDAWGAILPYEGKHDLLTQGLIAQRYSRQEWNFQR